MELQLQQDILLSHSVLNMLIAVSEGEHAALHLLTELQLARPEELQNVAQNLEHFVKWYKGLPLGDTLLSASWKKPQTFESKQAIQSLSDARAGISKVALIVRKAMSLPQLPAERAKIAYLLAAFIRYIYSAIHYANGMADLAQLTRNRKTTDEANEVIPQMQAERDQIEMMVAALKENETLPEEMTKLLRAMLIHVPGSLLSQVHEINIMLAPYCGGEKFIASSFATNEATEWNELGFTLVKAGYWRAYMFRPQEAERWIAAGFEKPSTAEFWRTAGYLPEDAQLLCVGNFTPESAKAWLDCGYTVQEALSYSKRGYTSPAQLPRGD